jgi:hypothetical protein
VKLNGKLAHEGKDGDEEVFVFYGYNPHNGEPWKPMEIRVKSTSSSIPHLESEAKKEETTLTWGEGP